MSNDADNRNSSNHSLAKQLQGLIALGEQELASAKADAWDEVEEQEKHRQKTLRQVLGGHLPEEMAAQIRACIEQIKQLEKQLLTLASNSKHDVAGQLKTLRHGNKAIKSYQQST